MTLMSAFLVLLVARLSLALFKKIRLDQFLFLKADLPWANSYFSILNIQRWEWLLECVSQKWLLECVSRNVIEI